LTLARFLYRRIVQQQDFFAPIDLPFASADRSSSRKRSPLPLPRLPVALTVQI
jgi:hypothetical protein